jgi:hypothetical protein
MKVAREQASSKGRLRSQLMCFCVHADPGPAQRMSRRSKNFDRR